MGLVEGFPRPLPLLVSSGSFPLVLGGILPLPISQVLVEDCLDGAELAVAEVLRVAAAGSTTFGPSAASAAGFAPQSSSSASASASAVASASSATSASFPTSMEQVPQQGTVADLVAGFIAPEAAAFSAPSASGADRGGSDVLVLPLPDEEEVRLLLRLRGYDVVEDLLPCVGVIGKQEGLRVGVRQPVPDAVSCHLVVKADHEGLDQVGVGLQVGCWNVGVGPGVEEPQAGGPGEDWLVLLLVTLAMSEAAAGRKRCSQYKLRRRVVSWASGMAAPAARPAGSPSPTGMSATYCLAAPVMATTMSRRWRRLSHPLMAVVMVKFCLHSSHSAPSPELNCSVRRPPLRAAARIWCSWSAGMPAMADWGGDAGHGGWGRGGVSLGWRSHHSRPKRSGALKLICGVTTRVAAVH